MLAAKEGEEEHLGGNILSPAIHQAMGRVTLELSILRDNPVTTERLYNKVCSTISKIVVMYIINLTGLQHTGLLRSIRSFF